MKASLLVKFYERLLTRQKLKRYFQFLEGFKSLVAPRRRVSNEESALLKKMQTTQPMESFTEREQFIIENLIRKSLITKIVKNNQTWVVSNERPQDSC